MNKKKKLVNIINYEKNGQKAFFGRDNLSFKTINLPKKQRFVNICHTFNLKKIIKKNSLRLSFFSVN